MKKISLKKETIRNLDDKDLQGVNGGRTLPNCQNTTEATCVSVHVCICDGSDPGPSIYDNCTLVETEPTYTCNINMC